MGKERLRAPWPWPSPDPLALPLLFPSRRLTRSLSLFSSFPSLLKTGGGRLRAEAGRRRRARAAAAGRVEETTAAGQGGCKATSQGGRGSGSYAVVAADGRMRRSQITPHGPPSSSKSQPWPAPTPPLLLLCSCRRRRRIGMISVYIQCIWLDYFRSLRNLVSPRFNFLVE